MDIGQYFIIVHLSTRMYHCTSLERMEEENQGTVG